MTDADGESLQGANSGSIVGVEILTGVRIDGTGRAQTAIARLAAALRAAIVEALVPPGAGNALSHTRGRLLVGAGALPEAEPGDIVWGGGLGGALEQRLVATAGVEHRGAAGPLAARAIREASGDDGIESTGDPLLMLGALFPELRTAPEVRSGVGVLADVDPAALAALEGVRAIVLDPDPFRAVAQLAACESLIVADAESLAIADALGIPVRLVRDPATLRAHIDDHALATGRQRPDLAASVAEALEGEPLPAPRIEIEALRTAFPAELWRAPAVSVVVPTSNVATWIDECLHSLLTQELDDLEVIVVDDRSSDGTVERARAVARRDRRVRVIAGAVTGGGSARNLGVELARGTYLAFADGDDLVPAGAYRALMDAGERSGSDLVLGRFLKFSASSTWDPTRAWAVFREERSGVDLVSQPSIIRGRACWNKLYRAEFFRGAQITFPDVPRSNDIVPVVTAYVRAKTIDVVRDRVYLYRDRPGGTSMTAKAGQLRGLRSYLTQECLCLELVRETGDAALLAEYTRMIVQSDGWVLITRVLETLIESSAEDEAAIADRMRVLLAGLSPHAIASMPLERAIVFALIAAGDLRGAAAALGEQTLLDAARAIGGLDRLVEASDALATGSADTALHNALALASARVALAAVDNGERDAASAAAAVARIAGRAPADGPSQDPRIGVIVAASLSGKHPVLEHLSALGSGSIVVQLARRTAGGLRIEGAAPLRAVGARLRVMAEPDAGGAAQSLAEIAIERSGDGAAWSFVVEPGGLPDGVWRLLVRLADAEGPEAEFVSRLRWSAEAFAEPSSKADRVTVHGRVGERYEVKLHAFATTRRRVARAVARRFDPRLQRVVASAIGGAKRVVRGAQPSNANEAKRAGD
ncbi:glycosyltransferase family 2 protein [Agrococcus sp. ARC_14]|uniref:glycosyltransferase family 2 protein n=1 Tax=Agrococcus sp. ARC_14 TaxID=2919927 RepID=UPI001F0604C1|nr:glycosyltransferase family 2 protein [Agrococcus sp. ARC_14]MCH1882336.1 glycosyltransferase [Agrococcus sp. ARC_14]